VSLPDINQSMGSLVFHEQLTLPGTAIGTENTFVTFNKKQVGQIIYKYEHGRLDEMIASKLEVLFSNVVNYK
jgi:hypothetical protein